jgi:hypothetical protein
MWLARLTAGFLVGTPICVSAEITDVSACAAPQTLSLGSEQALVLRLPTGAAAVVHLTTVGLREATYRSLYRSSEDVGRRTGSGRVFEDYVTVTLPGGDTVVTSQRNRPDDLYIYAGEIKLRWSANNSHSGWVYYCPSTATVRLVPVAEFESAL